MKEEEAERLPWHRVVGADARISPKMDAELARVQRERLEKEGMKVDERGFILEDEAHFHVVGARREIRWSEGED